MRTVTKPIVLAVSVVVGLGLITAAAADNHGAVVSATAKVKKPPFGDAHGAAVSTVAKTNGKSDAAERDANGDAMSSVATSDATAAHSTGAKKTNHGGAVSQAAHQR